jgi:hypothetical protein
LLALKQDKTYGLNSGLISPPADKTYGFNSGLISSPALVAQRVIWSSIIPSLVRRKRRSMRLSIHVLVYFLRYVGEATMEVGEATTWLS